MTVLLLDASVWLAAVDGRDAYHRPARELISRAAAGVDLAALDLTLLEVANVAITRWGAPSDALDLVKTIQASCPNRIERCDPHLVTAATIAAGQDGLSVYDATYVAAAARKDWTLVSADLRDLVRPGHAVAPDGLA